MGKRKLKGGRYVKIDWGADMAFNDRHNTLQHVNRHKRALQEYEQLVQQCWCIPQQSMRDTVNRAVLDEIEGHIYTCMDLPFFQVNHFHSLLTDTANTQDSPLIYGQVKGIRRLLGRPRRFSLKFILEERMALQRSRRA